MATTLPINDEKITSAIEASIAGVEESIESAEPIEGVEPVEPEVVEDPAAEPAVEPVVPVVAEPVKAGAEPKVSAVEPKAAPVKEKKRGPMPMDRHEAVLSTERRKHEAAMKELTDKYETPQVRTRLEAIEIAEKNPERFVDILEGDPRYKAIFEKRYNAPAAVVVPEPPLEAPKPNVIYEDGRLGYDEKGATELAKFHANAATEGLRKELAELKGQVAPVTKLHEKTAQDQRDYDDAIARQTKVLQNARTNWKGFTENEAKIKAVVLDPANVAKGMTLDQAYMQVVVTPMQETDVERTTRIRAEIEADVQKIAAAGSAVPAAGGAPAAVVTKPGAGKPRELEDVILQSIRAKA